MARGLATIQEISDPRLPNDGWGGNTYRGRGLTTMTQISASPKLVWWRRVRDFLAYSVLGAQRPTRPRVILRGNVFTAGDVAGGRSADVGVSSSPPIVAIAETTDICEIRLSNCVVDWPYGTTSLLTVHNGLVAIDGAYITPWKNHPVQQELRKYMSNPELDGED